MKKITTFVATIALFGMFGLVQANAAGLSKGKAERAVEKKIKSRYATTYRSADCRKLSRKLFSCSYTFRVYTGEFCDGGAKVKKYPFGITVKLGKPHDPYSPSTRCP